MKIDIQFISTLFSSIIIATFTSWITVRLSLKQFHSQRWWERKLEAYTQILNSLYDIKHTMQWHLEEYEGERKISDIQQSELNNKFMKGLGEIDRFANLDLFVFSKKIVMKVNELTKEINNVKGVDYYSDLEDYFNIASKYLVEIRDIAIKDLKISEIF
ncbi:MAG: hypothetical protein AB2L18_00325 [Anaerolineaceae bacterium]